MKYPTTLSLSYFLQRIIGLVYERAYQNPMRRTGGRYNFIALATIAFNRVENTFVIYTSRLMASFSIFVADLGFIINI